MNLSHFFKGIYKFSAPNPNVAPFQLHMTNSDSKHGKLFNEHHYQLIAIQTKILM